jgi:hypothetical protein
MAYIQVVVRVRHVSISALVLRALRTSLGPGMNRQLPLNAERIQRGWGRIQQNLSAETQRKH